MGVAKSLSKLLKLLYVGTMMSRLHASSYVVSCLSTVLWFLVIFLPVTAFSPSPEKAFRVFLPGVFAMGAAALGMWVATEFTRWFVYQGLTDFFRECGLGVIHYLVSAIHIDLGVSNVATFLASAAAISVAITGGLGLVAPVNPWLFALAIALSAPPYLLCGAIAAYMYCKTSISGTWTNIFQMLLIVGTVLPPSVLPSPYIALINPASIVAEVMRAAYGYSFIPLNVLEWLAPLVATVELVLAAIIARLADLEIAKRGLEYRV
ncbi:MAG: hypothetical protein GXO32_02405 [Crenarchaeota archaeon]|nr:hypothetical protein [Thermoproteota archaeon]